MKSSILLALILAFSSHAWAATAHPLQVELDGLVCSYCAQGLSQVLRKERRLEKYEIQVSRGRVLLWPNQTSADLRPEEIRAWVEKAGLRVRQIH